MRFCPHDQRRMTFEKGKYNAGGRLFVYTYKHTLDQCSTAEHRHRRRCDVTRMADDLKFDAGSYHAPVAIALSTFPYKYFGLT